MSAASGKRRAGQPLVQLVDDRDLVPAQVGRHQQRAAGGVDQPGQRHRRTDRPQALRLDGFERRRRQRAEAVEHGAHLHATVVAHVEAAMALGAGEVERAHRQVVDVDLEPERDDAAAGELDDLTGPPDRAALLEPALDQQLEADQLGDQARDRRLVETGLERDRRARARAVLGDMAEHHTQVVPADGTLIREPGATLHIPTLSAIVKIRRRPAAARRRGTASGPPGRRAARPRSSRWRSPRTPSRSRARRAWSPRRGSARPPAGPCRPPRGP